MAAENDAESVRDRVYTAVMGSSGSGKSTLMNLIAVSIRRPKAASKWTVLRLRNCAIGTGLRTVAAWGVTRYIEIRLTFPLEWVGIAVGVGVGVGVIAGLYPAWDAARTDPIDALRYE